MMRRLAVTAALLVGAAAATTQVFSAFTASARTTPSAFAAAAVFAPRSVTPPAITGVARVGETISASTGAWARTVDAHAYQWRRCDAAGVACVNIGGATAATRTLTSADAGHRLRVHVIASNAGGSTTAASEPTAVVGEAAAPVLRIAPSIQGTPKAGNALTANDGTWSSAVEFTTARQWLRCDATGAACTATGQTGPTFTPTAADAGATLRLRVTATNTTGGAAATADSPPTAPIAGSYRAQVLSEQPRLYYTFDDLAGASVPDATGNGRTGAFTHAAQAPGAWAASTSARFDGSASIAMPPDVIAGTRGFTWDGWVFNEAAPGTRLWQRIFDMGSGLDGAFWATPDPDRPGTWAAWHGRDYATILSADWQGTNHWYELTVTSDATSTTLYVDGTAVARGATGAVPADLPNDAVNWLGRSMAASDPLFLGRLDEVAIYDYALTPQQVARHHALAGT